MRKKLYLLFILSAGFLSSCHRSNLNYNFPETEAIRLNQIGYYPESKKFAAISAHEATGTFYLTKADENTPVYEGDLSEAVSSDYSDKKTKLADFSAFTQKGEYRLVIPSAGKSYPFKIEDGIFEELAKGSIKAFYYNRASSPLLEQHAGIWAREAGHPDDQVKIHASAASEQRPEGSVVSAPYGWYDAGDYNKYIVNSGITMGTLLSLYEDFNDYFHHQNLNIPESDNQNPDLLDEILWNLKWMLKMQDPNDGGVYHKLTTAEFEGMVMPHEATNQRYMVAKSTAATLNFAAVMAQASRIYKQYHPSLATECLNAAEKAWDWAKLNPAQLYRQDEINKIHIPQIQTGTYGDNNVEDEWIWAAAELYISTQNISYQENISGPVDSFTLPNWSNVGWLGYYSLLRHRNKLNNPPKDVLDKAKNQLLNQADVYVESVKNSRFHSVMGKNASDFNWGSNSNAANQGILLIQAYLLSDKQEYLEAALSNLDYILGRNATGYSFITGYGSKTPLYPHHRPSEAEPDKAPVPGFLVGGPNPGQQDNCDYPSNIPDESYIDETCSYASNEIAINWNAPLAYLTNALEAIYSK
ncbi:glycoside hydrolase family 9 protein [Anditalea andensis]|uniref:Endoglucanase n=1 Tax=Anditalea andensis TaxID=1048983 RepID=A0A074KVM6_9BACT|nr:glycoside hydrolase family 9 protein [Anditalea andensis]KEO72999.1 cellulase [Anditalea andensis]